MAHTPRPGAAGPGLERGLCAQLLSLLWDVPVMLPTTRQAASEQLSPGPGAPVKDLCHGPSGRDSGRAGAGGCSAVQSPFFLPSGEGLEPV